MLVLILFFCSGATALIYEVLWSKYLSLMLGSTVQAQTVVLAVFMGGLAIGNRLFGRRSREIQDHLRTYAILELIIGAYAFLFPRLFRLGDYIFVNVGSVIVDTPVLPLILKLLVSVSLLIVPTILMGGTLPVLAAWIERRNVLDPGARVGIFYAVNSLGAVAGAGLAGFYLLQRVGLVSTAELTGVANLLIGFFAVVLSKMQSVELPAPATRHESASSTVTPKTEAPAISLTLVVALTGGVSMGLEVLSSRALAMIAGGSVQSFALVLMSFILGIGLGSVIISANAAAKRHAQRALYVLLFSAATLVIIHVLAIEKWAISYATAKYGFAPNSIGYLWHQLAVGVIAFVFLGLPASCLGAVVPLAIRAESLERTGLGDQVGRLLTWNTIGAVIGVVCTGFFFMPVFGLRAALAVLALLLIAAAGLIALKRHENGVAIGALVFGLACLVGFATTGDKWQQVMSAGVFRVRTELVTAEGMEIRKKTVPLVYYKDSADATVSVERTIVGGTLISNSYQLTLRLNGKSDASTLGDVATQYLLAHLPMAARPNATNVFVLGFGSGITGGAILGHPIQRLTIAENSAPVLEAAPLFNHWNRGVLTNARSRIINDDARSVLKLRPDRYDVIISEPSNPWVAGIGNVFSQDFYELCASRLTEGGVMAQWFHKYEMSDEIVFLVFRTFASVFPFMEIWDSQEGDLILLGSQKPWPSDPSRYQILFERAQPASDMAGLRIPSAVALWARQVASQKIGAAIPGDGAVQTDEFPLLEYAAPRAFFIGGNANRMYFFDERTVQFPLADRAKLEALRSLSTNSLVESFTMYGASNPDLKLYLISLMSKGQQRIDPMGHLIFRAPESYPEDPTIGSKARTELIECVKAEAGLLRDDAHWQQYAKRIEQILTQLIAKNEVQLKEFKPEYFAAVAVRCAIGHQDYQAALEILRLGFVFAPNDEHLAFLSRVLDRVVPPELLERTRDRQKQQQPKRL